MTEPKTIPYHELPHESTDSITITGIIEYQLSGSRLVQVAKVENENALFVRIYRPLPDGSRCVLKFRMSYEAAFALSNLLGAKLVQLDIDPATILTQFVKEKL